MKLLDAAALIAFLRGEPAQHEVEALLRASAAAISAVNLAEVTDQLVRRGGLPFNEVQTVLAGLLDDALIVRACTMSHGLRAGLLRARHYHRRTAPLSLGDCVLLASAEDGDTVVSSDRALLRIACAEGLDTLALLDSFGRRP